jgi:hypothetical protein
MNFFSRLSREPLGDPSARAFEVFLKVSQSLKLAHQDILGGWRVGLTNSSPVLNFEEERGRAPD